ncbi:MAG: transporter substrate-binding domain-containing protein [Solirubrobacteraceae bacterium]|nr:transporter substrate-binding domain-containing protein [Solirubrobacteraceae bacterium]
MKSTRGLAALVAGAAMLTFTACGSDDDGGSTAADTTESATAVAEQPVETGFKPINEGKLTVGMNLQFKPQMYLDDNGEPAGYDVELLKMLAPDLGAELNIQNLDFNGLIPGLQSNQFDMVSVGLSPTPERQEVVDFTRGYVPYDQIVGVPADKASQITSKEDLNKKGTVITALQGGTAESLAKEEFPNATVKGFPDQNAAFLEVATGRADAVVVEGYLLAQFDKSNPGKLAKAELAEPLHVEYGSWAVPKGNEEFVKFLDNWLCEKQNDGTLAKIYEQVFEAEIPPMPEGC